MADPQTWRERLAPLAYKVVALLLTAFLGALATWLGLPPQVVTQIVEAPALVETTGPAPPPDARGATGWVRDDDAVRAVAETLPHPVFADTPAGQAESIPDRIYLWDAAREATGYPIPARDQGSVGSCVPFGAACAVEHTQCVAMVAAKRAGQPPPEFRAVAQEPIYGGSRVQIGGGRIRGDGSVGAWAARWCQDYGSVARAKYGAIDLTAYSESRCRAWGNTGCPAELIPEAKAHSTRTISQVRTTAELKRALASGYPVTVASDVGFGSRGPYTRNAKGQLRASGTWAHQMCFIGYDAASGFYCMNSWGAKWVGGPPGPGEPPAGGFYVEEQTAARMLGQGDSWAYGDTVGFPARAIDNWFISRPRRPHQPDLPDLRFLAQLSQ